MEPIAPHTEERPWGRFITFTKNSPSTVKIIIVRAGETLSLQTHSQREEFWYVISGTGMVRIGEQETPAAPGMTFSVPVGTAHRLSGTTDLTLLEISQGNFDENDIVRLEDKYGRVSANSSLPLDEHR